jgi:ketosteroid isomerase-like protein
MPRFLQPISKISGKPSNPIALDGCRADPAVVQSTLDKNAVLIPHHGDHPVVGIDAIKSYWWPKNAPATKTVRLDITLEEVGGDSCYAFVRGNDSVEWVMTTSAGEQKYGNAGTYLNVMLKQSDGSWRILQHMWDDPANPRR